MTDDRKISEYKFSEMNFSLENVINIAKNNSYIEGHFRVGTKIARLFQVREIDGKVKIF